MDFTDSVKIKAQNKFQEAAGFLKKGLKKEYISDDEPYEEFENRELVIDDNDPTIKEMDAFMFMKQEETNWRKQKKQEKANPDSKYQKYKDKFGKQEL